MTKHRPIHVNVTTLRVVPCPRPGAVHISFIPDTPDALMALIKQATERLHREFQQGEASND